MNSRDTLIFVIVFVLLILLSGCVQLVKKSDPQSSHSLPNLGTFKSIEPFVQSPRLNRIQAILFHRNLLWLGTPDGLYSFEYPSMQPNELREQTHLSGESVTALAVNREDTLFAVGSKTGLHALPNNSNEFYSTGSTKVRDIAIAPGDSAVYCATSHGIDIFQNDTWRNIKIVSSSKFASQANDLTAITVDSTGTWWLGTTFGLYRMNSAGNFDFVFGDYQIISGSLIINERGNSPLGGNLFYSINFSQKSNRLLLNTNGGLAEISPPENYTNDKNWKIYSGDHTTSKMIDGQIQSIPVKGNSPLPNNFIKLSLEIGDNLYIGSDDGLAHFNRQTQSWSHYNIDNQLSGDQVLSLYSMSQPDHELLFVGTSGGLSILQIPKSQPKEES